MSATDLLAVHLRSLDLCSASCLVRVTEEHSVHLRGCAADDITRDLRRIVRTPATRRTLETTEALVRKWGCGLERDVVAGFAAWEATGCCDCVDAVLQTEHPACDSRDRCADHGGLVARTRAA